jgi:hypothetical protein
MYVLGSYLPLQHHSDGGAEAEPAHIALITPRNKMNAASSPPATAVLTMSDVMKLLVDADVASEYVLL